MPSISRLEFLFILHFTFEISWYTYENITDAQKKQQNKHSLSRLQRIIRNC